MRSRLTLLATALVTIALVIAGAVLILVLHTVLLNKADDANSARVSTIAEALAERGPSELDDSLFSTDQNVDLVQVVDASGQVVRSSRARPGGPLGAPLQPGRRVEIDGAQSAPSDAEYRATRVGVRAADGTALTVEAGTAEAGINTLVLLVAALCAAVFPLIVAAMATLTYFFVGRALRPVEQIRRRVSEISAADLADLVPVPGTRDEIELLARTMNAMLTRLKTAQTTQRQFVGDASHELNSPLTSIYGLLDLADHTGEPIDVETVRTLLLPEAARMRTLVADLALLARGDEGAAPVRHERVDLEALVTAEADLVTATRAVSVHCTTVPAFVDGDAARLARAIRNLTDNAARYAASRLTITMASTAESVTVAVSDDGPGVSAADRERVFDRFVRLDDARDRAAGGSGLGLAIVAEIVNAHSGLVGVDAAPDGGARFWFSLPLARSDSRRP
ncbi:sensor histidine kinase [Gordonia hydrophobica]|uniref:histidine kinase n=1 Tax=Gordonia hydrophobica TaxID=40516 RepID=A0ABZ2U467_9ACTN|nr:ATP-binding protein [Gordonia hydrophobica]MBM7368107.1 signal transduction histidine kinase [Gordonia hydrophobica]